MASPSTSMNLGKLSRLELYAESFVLRNQMKRFSQFISLDSIWLCSKAWGFLRRAKTSRKHLQAFFSTQLIFSAWTSMEFRFCFLITSPLSSWFCPKRIWRSRRTIWSSTKLNFEELRFKSCCRFWRCLYISNRFQSETLLEHQATSKIKSKIVWNNFISFLLKLRVVTFGQLKPRLTNIMMSALQIETDSQNTHMLLGGLLLCVQDSVTFEEFDAGAASDGQSTSARETNLLSSGENR